MSDKLQPYTEIQQEQNSCKTRWLKSDRYFTTAPCCNLQLCINLQQLRVCVSVCVSLIDYRKANLCLFAFCMIRLHFHKDSETRWFFMN